MEIGGPKIRENSVDPMWLRSKSMGWPWHNGCPMCMPVPLLLAKYLRGTSDF